MLGQTCVIRKQESYRECVGKEKRLNRRNETSRQRKTVRERTNVRKGVVTLKKCPWRKFEGKQPKTAIGFSGKKDGEATTDPAEDLKRGLERGGRGGGSGERAGVLVYIVCRGG